MGFLSVAPGDGGDSRKTAVQARDMGAHLLFLDASLLPHARSGDCPASVPPISGRSLRILCLLNSLHHLTVKFKKTQKTQENNFAPIALHTTHFGEFTQVSLHVTVRNDLTAKNCAGLINLHALNLWLSGMLLHTPGSPDSTGCRPGNESW